MRGLASKSKIKAVTAAQDESRTRPWWKTKMIHQPRLAVE
jgi:hypothetical protein